MVDPKLNELQRQRQEKLAKLKSLSSNIYPQPNLENKLSTIEAKEKMDEQVLIAGRIMSLRGHGKIMFADLQDRVGKIQLFFQQNTLGEKMSDTKLLDLGDIVSISGKIFKTAAGEITVDVQEFQILAKNIRPLPEKFHGLKDVEIAYRQRAGGGDARVVEPSKNVHSVIIATAIWQLRRRPARQA
jgi:lysyl-tRNA synthetase class 2